MTGGAGRSAAALHAQSILRNSSLAILSSTGFRRASSQTADLLTEVLQRYVQLIARTAESAAVVGNRTQVVPRDIALALEELGSSVEEIKGWLEMEGAEEKELSKLTHNHERAAALRDTLHAGRGPLPLPEERPVISFEHLSDSRVAELQKDIQRSRDAASEEDSGDEGSDDLFSDAGGPSAASSATSHAMNVDEPEYLAEESSLIPSHLPPLPTQEGAGLESEIAALRSSSPISTSSKSKGKRKAEEESSLTGMRDDARIRKVIEDVWKETVPFAQSQLRETYTNLGSDLPAITAPESIPSASRASSLHAFAADFIALRQERGSSASAGILMTPEDAQNAPIRTKRRRIAAVIADPMRFMPLDSLHAAISVRPASQPFNPSPSLLITLPSDGSAPVFTPANPHGRLVCLSPPSGAAQPILGYRWPSQVQGAVRTVAELDVQRKVARIEDPPPLYDSQHVERVFRGASASRQLLGMAHSALAPALNLLAVQQRRQLGSEAEDEDLELPSKGTLVYTWDWTTKDPFDTTLPGKRVNPQLSEAQISEVGIEEKAQEESQPQPQQPEQQHSSEPKRAQEAGV